MISVKKIKSDRACCMDCIHANNGFTLSDCKNEYDCENESGSYIYISVSDEHEAEKFISEHIEPKKTNREIDDTKEFIAHGQSVLNGFIAQGDTGYNLQPTKNTPRRNSNCGNERNYNSKVQTN
jgi:hypothetical protein